MSSRAPRRAGRTALVLLQLLVFIGYVLGPTATMAEDPLPEPTPAESPAPEETPAPESSQAQAPAPSQAPPSQAPAPSQAPSVEPTPVAPPDPEPSVSGPGTEPYLITFAAGTSDARQIEILTAAGAADVDAIPQLAMRSILLHAESEADELATLRATHEVVRVDADRTRTVEADPSDASYPYQWSLPRIGWDQLYGSAAIAGAATVAILDTGVDASHPDLDGVVLPGASVLDGSDAWTDPNGHGTWMAGIVAAETDNGFGVAGTAYAGVSILPVTVLGADGTGQDSDIIAGVVHAADAGADVILMAFSNPGYSAALQAAIDYAWASGAVLVAATGNDHSSLPTFPAGDRGVIGVASTDPSDALALFSNSGAAAFMAAPGLDVLTTDVGGSTQFVSGTSVSAAMVAGAAGLMAANEPSLSNGVIVGRLARTADAAGDPADTGNGRLNLLRAMSDTSTDAIQPAGAAPVGDGGPLVGPYVAAANQVTITITCAPASVSLNGASTCTVNVTDTHPNNNTLPTGTIAFNRSAGPVGAAGTFSGSPCTIVSVGAISSECAVSYTPTAGVGTHTIRAVYTTTSDHQDGTSRAVTFPLAVTAAAARPVIDLNGATAGINNAASFTEDGAVVTLASGANVTDADSANLASAQVRLVDRPDGTAESLAVSGCVAAITVTPYNSTTGILALSGSSSLASYQTCLRLVAYNNTDQDPDATSRSIEWTVNDGALNNTPLAVTTLTVTPVNDRPVIDLNGATAGINNAASFTEDGAVVTLASGANVTDADSANLASAQVRLVDRPDGTAESLAVSGCVAAITVTPYNSTTGILALSGSSSLASYQTCLRLVAYNNTDQDPDATSRSIEWTVNDGALNNTPLAVTTLTVTPVNDRPVIDLNGATAGINNAASFTEDGAVVTLASGANVTDADSANLASAQVRLVDRPDGTAESLAVSGCVAAITVTPYNSTTGILALSGSSSLASYQTCLRLVAYNNTDQDPDATSRSIEWTVNDGALNNTPLAVTTLTVTPVNDAPSVVISGVASVGESQTLHTFSFDTTDPDSPDTFSAGTPDCGSGVFVGPITFSTATGDGSFDCRFADDNPTATASDLTSVSISITDDDTGVGSDSHAVTVNNVDPSVVISGPSSVDESQTLRTYSFDTSDPGLPDTFSAGTPDCGSGVFVGPITFSTATGDGSFDCRFADDNPTATASDLTSVSISITDDDTGVGSDSHAVTVNNVDPSVVISGPSSVDESQTLRTYSFDTSDPGLPDTFSAGTPDCGSGVFVGPITFSTATGDGSFDCRFADDNPTATASDLTSVSISITDDDTGVGSDSHAVTVNNVDPSVVISGPSSVDESQTLRTYSFDTSDPGLPDTFSAGTPDCGSGVFVGPITFSTATGDGSFDCRFADDNPTATASDLTSVSISITDDDTGVGSDSHAVTVNNVDPSVVISGPSSVDESQTLRTYSFDTSDPGLPDTFSAGTPDCGSGVFVGPITFSTATGDGSFDCRFADDNPTATASDLTSVSISITDDDTGVGSDSHAVTVNNVDPSVVISGPSSVDESQTLRTYSFDTSDPGLPDTFSAGTPDCGSGVFVGPITFSTATGDGSFDCRFADDNPTATASDLTSVSISITDDDTGVGSDSHAVTVNNVDPSVVISGPSSVDESQTLRTYSFDTSDPGLPDTFSAGTPDCGSGVFVGPITFSTATGDGSFDCRFADDNPTATASDLTSVSISITDDDTGVGSDSHAVTVNNVDPSVVISGPSSVDESQTLRTYSFDTSDPGLPDTFSAGTPDCGSGVFVGPITFSTATGDGSFDCRFADDNPTATASDLTSVSISITDDDTGVGSDSHAVTVNNVDPALLNQFFSYNPFTGNASARIDFSDPGATDMHSAIFDWAGVPDAGTPSLIEHAPPDATGRFTSNHDFGPGCIAGAVSVTVTDDDGGSATYTFAAAGTLARYTATWQAPLRDGMRNVVKHGNVIPLKIRIADCLGNPVVGTTLTVGVTQGIVSSDDIENGTAVVTMTESVGSHTDGVMRYVDSHYMYNLATKPLKLALPYTIVIREQSTGHLVATAVIEPKK